MSVWVAKRFWTTASAQPCDGGYTVRLDDRSVKTPAKAPLVVPTLALAQGIAAEWNAQIGVIKPATMPLTRAANSAIDKVAPLLDAVIDELTSYGGTDLLCYRATHPQALIDRQADAWDPLVEWAATSLHAPLRVTQGVIPVDQPISSLARLRGHVDGFDNFGLSGLHDLVAISGSLVLALAVASGKLEAATAFALSRVDNHWQAEAWGQDEEEAETEALRAAAFAQADRFLTLCR
ncbi:MAG: ATP12 family protein [Paracoccaceae bacterium]